MQLNVLRERSEKAPWKRGKLIPKEERIFSANVVGEERGVSLVCGATYLAENSENGRMFIGEV